MEILKFFIKKNIHQLCLRSCALKLHNKNKNAWKERIFVVITQQNLEKIKTTAEQLIRCLNLHN